MSLFSPLTVLSLSSVPSSFPPIPFHLPCPSPSFTLYPSVHTATPCHTTSQLMPHSTSSQLTHFVMVKELKQLHSIEALDCSDSVKHKTRDFVRKYMSKYGSVFKRDPNDTKEY